MNKKENYLELERERKKRQRENKDNFKIGLSIWDIHGKDYNRKTISIFKDFIKDLKPDFILFGGDEENFDGISKYSAKNISSGLQECIDERIWFKKNIYYPIIDSYDEGINFPDIYMCGGNHNCQRVTDILKKLREKGEDLLADSFEEKIDPHKHFPEAKICKYNKWHKIGKLLFTHGIYHRKHHAAKHAEIFGCNVCYGHLHTVQTHTRTNLGNPHKSESMPCACDLNPDYLKNKPTSWINGFGVHYIFPDGNYNTYRIEIINGRTIFNNKVYR